MTLEIGVQELKGKLHEVLLIDCRRQEEWDICRIDGALLYPLADFAQHLPAMKTQAGERRVVVYCHTGRRSLVAAQLLRTAGVDALSLRGGIDEWADIDPTIARY